jgi:hypothetical protein
MSVRDRVRLEVFSRVRDEQITVTKAATLLRLSIRQARRLWRRYREVGDVALVAGLRGKPCNRKRHAATRAAVLKRYVEDYHDFGPTLACEHLAGSGHVLDRETLRRWLVAEGLWQRKRRRKQHRSRRERRACLGEMVQMDGSHHDWFEGRGPWCVLMVMVDDATGQILCRFFKGETTSAAMEVFGTYARKHGLPRSLYVDRDSIYRSDRQGTSDEALRAESPLTQFGRAMKRLAVELILAHSPQAKGRVERCNGTLQDRLVKAMRLAKIDDIASANRFLEKTFLPSFNKRFMVTAREPADLHVRVSKVLGKGARLDEVLCFEEKRVVLNDWCVQWRRRVFQLDRRHEGLGLAGREVLVREKLDGSVQLLSRGRLLRWRELPQRPKRMVAAKPVIKNNRRWVPPIDHPWKRGLGSRASSPSAPQPSTPEPAGVTVLLR